MCSYPVYPVIVFICRYNYVYSVSIRYVILGMSDVQTADHGSLLLNYPAESGETHGQQTGEKKFYVTII